MRDVLLPDLMEVRGVAFLEREQLSEMIEGVDPPDRLPRELADFMPTGTRAFYAPAEMESAIQRVSGRVVRAGHILTGSFVVDRDRVVTSAWLLDVDSAHVDAVASVRVPRDSLFQGISDLGRRLRSQLARRTNGDRG